MGYPESPAQIHHIRHSFGTAQRAPHQLVIPLCHEHHLGKTGIHSGKEAFEMQWGSELALVAESIDRVIKGLIEQNRL